jgi:hypothetical protein
MKHAHHDENHPDRSIDLQEELDAEIGETIAEANHAGYGTEETVEALEAVIENTKLALDLDPDPADDPE